MKKLLKSKTIWAAVAAIVGAIGSYFTEDIEFGEMLQLIVTSALAVFLRHGVAKVEKKVEEKVE